MEAVAKLNNCPIAPRKMMLVADAVRGAQVIDALNTLRFAQKAGAPLVEKLILSAVANWEAKNPDESVEDADLYVKTIFVTGGRQLKRFRPAPQGRAHRIRKRSNHVTVVVDARNTSLIDVVAEDTESNESDN
ncbi:50S ribosomal protein L22 [Flammeovirga yaeyamensis]|uniref:Large ribosomal subunit protein uL22 n=1 Tax=Flammeovirga yaeyamensis TaxID=367791 RepID=A0AAX1N6V9_9BACT|nr:MULTISPECIES: 50S ribosomal protein L22 [Flammeovirga]ANQ51054.1 50S ribosomal protein L22 [Flammeovirga sp. MY04]MBB3698080.1 large subunit ribosomal protein L22 [Flammeovirga yaeyamensis]NMF34561.1 50S ribosomal protein L22 [Flammeovirga yaeyamensis]QWG01538.1 50S ribosomal protein L22 [Flammeovirga yaeyamensis]